MDVCGGLEAWEAIEVAKSGVNRHDVIVADFAKVEKTKNALKIGMFQGAGMGVLPTRIHEEP